MAMKMAGREHQARWEEADEFSCNCGCGGLGHRKAIRQRLLRTDGRRGPSSQECPG